MAPPEPTNKDETYDSAMSAKMAQIWAAMWHALVESGVPEKVATKMVITYLRATLKMVSPS